MHSAHVKEIRVMRGMQNCVLTEPGVSWYNYGSLKTVSNLY